MFPGWFAALALFWTDPGRLKSLSKEEKTVAIPNIVSVSSTVPRHPRPEDHERQRRALQQRHSWATGSRRGFSNYRKRTLPQIKIRSNHLRQHHRRHHSHHRFIIVSGGRQELQQRLVQQQLVQQRLVQQRLEQQRLLPQRLLQHNVLHQRLIYRTEATTEATVAATTAELTAATSTLSLLHAAEASTAAAIAELVEALSVPLAASA